MTTYPSRNYMVHTVRGGVWWLVFWTVFTTPINVLNWRTHRLWPLVFALALAPIVSGRILHYLRRRERAGHLPGESEVFLFELAVLIPLVWNAMLLVLTSAAR